MVSRNPLSGDFFDQQRALRAPGTTAFPAGQDPRFDAFSGGNGTYADYAAYQQRNGLSGVGNSMADRQMAANEAARQRSQQFMIQQAAAHSSGSSGQAGPVSPGLAGVSGTTDTSGAATAAIKGAIGKPLPDPGFSTNLEHNPTDGIDMGKGIDAVSGPGNAGKVINSNTPGGLPQIGGNHADNNVDYKPGFGPAPVNPNLKNGASAGTPFVSQYTPEQQSAKLLGNQNVMAKWGVQDPSQLGGNATGAWSQNNSGNYGAPNDLNSQLTQWGQTGVPDAVWQGMDQFQRNEYRDMGLGPVSDSPATYAAMDTIARQGAYSEDMAHGIPNNMLDLVPQVNYGGQMRPDGLPPMSSEMSYADATGYQNPFVQAQAEAAAARLAAGDESGPPASGKGRHGKRQTDNSDKDTPAHAKGTLMKHKIGKPLPDAEDRAEPKMPAKAFAREEAREMPRHAEGTLPRYALGVRPTPISFAQYAASKPNVPYPQLQQGYQQYQMGMARGGVTGGGPLPVTADPGSGGAVGGGLLPPMVINPYTGQAEHHQPGTPFPQGPENPNDLNPGGYQVPGMNPIASGGTYPIPNIPYKPAKPQEIAYNDLPTGYQPGPDGNSIQPTYGNTPHQPPAGPPQPMTPNPLGRGAGQVPQPMTPAGGRATDQRPRALQPGVTLYGPGGFENGNQPRTPPIYAGGQQPGKPLPTGGPQPFFRQPPPRV